MVFSSKPESWREALKFINRCPICAETYQTEKAQLFAATDTASLIHIACPKCQSYFVAMVVTVGQGLSSVGMVTDLSFEDIHRLFKKAPITVDETIEGHQAINQKQFLQTLILNG